MNETNNTHIFLGTSKSHLLLTILCDCDKEMECSTDKVAIFILISGTVKLRQPRLSCRGNETKISGTSYNACLYFAQFVSISGWCSWRGSGNIGVGWGLDIILIL